MNPPHPDYPPTLGATYLGDGRCRFLVWGSKLKSLQLKVLGSPERIIDMNRRDDGYFEATVDGVEPGTRYFYRIDNERDRPDPASRFQPDGVHAASSITDRHFDWTDRHWHGISLHKYITYELHVGTFTAEGTFDAAIEQLDTLRDLGITAIELMPVAQFPGGRNWGYDGVHPFAVQNTYGGPLGLKRLVDAAHARGLAVVMDVVYNHIGPEGNYLAEFGHYFTARHHTMWGEALNFDDRHSDDVRRFFIENALYWIDEFHIDALRLDAVHAILDFSAEPFLQELADAVRVEGERLNRHVYTIAESSLNDVRTITPKEAGGVGIDGQWCDDLHHSLRTEMMSDRSGYFSDFHGFEDVVKTYRDNFVLDGGYSAFRGRRHGNSARNIDPIKLVVCAQNHDQVGNRQFGERLTELVSFEQLKLAAGVVILSPFQPMLFMGEEYAETARFQYFVSHSDSNLIEAVRNGRKAEFTDFNWQDDPPDPQDEATFLRGKLNHEMKAEGRNKALWEYYQQLISLRKNEPSLAYPDRQKMEIRVPQGIRALTMHRWSAGRDVFCALHFGETAAQTAVCLPPGAWRLVLNSAEERWHGNGATLPSRVESNGQIELTLPPHSVCVYVKTETS